MTCEMCDVKSDDPVSPVDTGMDTADGGAKVSGRCNTCQSSLCSAHNVSKSTHGGTEEIICGRQAKGNEQIDKWGEDRLPQAPDLHIIKEI